MKKAISLILAASLVLCGCQRAPAEETTETTSVTETTGNTEPVADEVTIVLDGNKATVSDTGAVTVGGDIVYYEEGKDFTYGEGTEADAHSRAEAGEHLLVTITQPGTYRLSGTSAAAQVAVDLGEEAEDDPAAVVTLILDGVDITCSVAPAIIFYNVYECGDKDDPQANVDTSAAGANVVIADGTVNNVTGSYVARIYEPGSVVLSQDGTEVEDAKKLHKYDAAFYSKMSMNINGNDGVLNIRAENEGLDSELHLTVGGGILNITSGNDGINTNEDGVSVTTVNGGVVNIVVSGETGEGDGIDSNGWLVINGGTVMASACGFSGDAGIDSDMGIHINGGTVMAAGNMLDRIEGAGQTFAVFTFASSQPGGSTYTLKNADGDAVLEWAPTNSFTYLILAGDQLIPGEYTFWQGETQLACTQGTGMSGPGMIQPIDGKEPPDAEIPPQPTQPIVTYGQEPPADIQGMTPPEGMEGMEPPEGMTPPEGMEGMEPPELEGMAAGDDNIRLPYEPVPGGGQGGRGGQGGWGQLTPIGELSTTFTIAQGANYFTSVTAAE